MKLDGMQVLLVEDCPDQQRMLLHILENEGASVYLECDGFAAVRTVQKSIRKQSPFDAVIMDLVLEASDGIDSTASIFKLDKKLPVVAITANGSPQIELRWRRAGCVEYLEKPINAQLLIAAVRHAIDKTNASQSKQSIDLSTTPTVATPMLDVAKLNAVELTALGSFSR
jgi:CheY-like chemotaxis protein